MARAPGAGGSRLGGEVLMPVFLERARMAGMASTERSTIGKLSDQVVQRARALGSVSDKLAHHAPCDVLIVRGGVDG